MKILHIITTLSSGGAEKMLVDIVKQMQKLDVLCEVLVLTKEENFFGYQLDELNIPVYYGETNKVYSLKNILFIREIINANVYDCIHTHLFASQLYTPIAIKISKNNIPLITTEHSTHNKRRDIKIFLPLDCWIYKQYERIIAVSADTKLNLTAYLPQTKEKTVVIENGIELERYKNASSIEKKLLNNRISEKDIIILMVAAMREQKDQETLIRASKLLPKDYRVVFVGDGERFYDVKKYAEENGRENIVFLGRRTDIPSILATADVFVLSSKWEGFGLVVVEASAAGLPIVASDVGGLREVVKDIGGYLFKPGNEQDLANKIVKSLQENSKKKSNSLEKYDINSTVISYIDLYREILHKFFSF